MGGDVTTEFEACTDTYERMILTNDQKRSLGVGVLVALASTLLVLHVYNIWQDVRFGGESLYTALLEFAFPGLLTMMILLVPLWLRYRDVSGEYAWQISKWSVGAIVGGLALMAWTLGIQLFVQNGIDLYVLVGDTAIIAAVSGIGIGVYNTQMLQRQEDLEESEQRYRSLTEDVLDSSDVGIFILNAEFDVVWVNEATERYFGIDRTEIIGRNKLSVLTEYVDDFEDSERFESRISRTYEENPATEQFECHLLAGDDHEERWLEHRSRPIASGLYAGGRIEHYTDISAQKETTQTLERRERLLREMHDVLLDRGRSLDDRATDLLDIGKRVFGAEHAALAKVDGDEYEFSALASSHAALDEGAVYDLSETYCETVLEADETRRFSFDGSTTAFLDRDWFTDYGIEGYVGSPVTLTDDHYGTMCFFSESSTTDPQEWEYTLLELMASGISNEIQRERREAEREQELRETREQFTSLVEDVEEYAIFRVDAEGNVVSWNRGAEQIEGYHESEIVGEHISAFYPVDDDEAIDPDALLEQARHENRVEDEGWLVRKDGSRFYANVALTALRDDDGIHRGFINVVRDMTNRRRKRERELEHERERLEFVNRLIRHNLLNGMNVILGRARVLRENRDDEEDDPHLEVIVDRTTNMIDRIERMRLFMKTIVGDEDHELQPVELEPLLEQEVEKARSDYGGAEFDVELDFETGTVRADDLLPEVFQNLLTNAVQHNDKTDPRVTVTAAERDDCIAIHVADNGPGVDETLKSQVFEKGKKGFESPGTGFGLYLSRELIDSYGGGIRVEDNYPEGSVFTVSLPRATTADDSPKRASNDD